jgi:hypothetical protein
MMYFKLKKKLLLCGNFSFKVFFNGQLIKSGLSDQNNFFFSYRYGYDKHPFNSYEFLNFIFISDAFDAQYTQGGARCAQGKGSSAPKTKEIKMKFKNFVSIRNARFDQLNIKKNLEWKLLIKF